MTSGQGEAIPLFFAFPDGVYDHVCPECTAICCRGHGFAGNLQREVGSLLTLYPPLQSFAVSRDGEIVTFLTPKGGCYFLDADNLCRIEKEHGKTMKPGVCTLFPFNLFTRVGKTIVVSPHFMCPLRIVVPARPGMVEGTHSRLEIAVRESALLDPVYLDTHVKSINFHSSMNAASLLARELGFRDSCSQALGKKSFAQTLAEESANPEELDALVSRSVRIMGLEMALRPSMRDGIDDLMLALASPLRLKLLHLPSEAILRALALSELAVRQSALFQGHQITLQGAYDTATNLGSAIRLLARGDEPFEHAESIVLKTPPFGNPELTFAMFAALREIGAAGGILSALEGTIGPSLSGADRSVLLVKLGTQLDHTHGRRRKKKTVD